MRVLFHRAFRAPVQAQDVDCKNATSQNEMNFCADQDFQKADKALNAAYKKVIADMDDPNP
ncbi:MAG: DUF1311 domain-containing protein [Proteobacteria bacterium]|nr:DUF1311 domain-containing protein [Pseudomonadota bacterium]